MPPRISRSSSAAELSRIDASRQRIVVGETRRRSSSPSGRGGGCPARRAIRPATTFPRPCALPRSRCRRRRRGRRARRELVGRTHREVGRLDAALLQVGDDLAVARRHRVRHRLAELAAEDLLRVGLVGDLLDRLVQRRAEDRAAQRVLRGSAQPWRSMRAHVAVELAQLGLAAVGDQLADPLERDLLLDLAFVDQADRLPVGGRRRRRGSRLAPRRRRRRARAARSRTTTGTGRGSRGCGSARTPAGRARGTLPPTSSAPAGCSRPRPPRRRRSRGSGPGRRRGRR